MREYTSVDGHADAGEATRPAAAYAELYRTRNRQLVAYATSLTGDALIAEDLVAQAHFRVWRRLRSGHEVENTPAFLTTTLRELAAGLGRTQREIDADTADRAARGDAGSQDPAQHARRVDLLARLLKQLPERSVDVLWYAEAEDLPAEVIALRIGESAGTAASIVAGAREQLEEAFLRSGPGRPADESCAEYWQLMPSVVQGNASARKTRRLEQHADECGDCRARRAVLTEADSRFPHLLGPALLAAVLGADARPVPAASDEDTATLPVVTPTDAPKPAPAAVAPVADVAAEGPRTPRTGARHARVKPKADGRTDRRSASRSKMAVRGVLISSVAVVGIAAAATALALGATGTHHTANAAAAVPSAAGQPASNTSTATPVGATTGKTSAAASPTAPGTTPLGTLVSQATQAVAQVTQAAATQSASPSSSTGAATSASSSASGSASATAPATSASATGGSSTSSSPSTPPTSPSGGASSSPTSTTTSSTPSAPATTSASPSTSETSETSSAAASPSAAASETASPAASAAAS